MKITQIKETCLYIKDIPGARQFYHEVMGFPIISEVDGRHIFFRTGKSVLLCFIAEVTREDDTLPPHFAFGNQHLAFEVASGSYEQEKQNIRDKGIKIIHEQPWHDHYESFYFLDYEQNVLEIVPEGLWGI
jgi:catechol 2,3-dioxygenase-like lactoylglutathione lyase family enzyme